MASALRQLVIHPTTLRHSLSPHTSSRSPTFLNLHSNRRFLEQSDFRSCVRLNLRAVSKASPVNGGLVLSEDTDGVSLGTMKLPLDTDMLRFESLLFQWANSLCQGANLPLPVPLKVDKIAGGARIGFITMGDGETEVHVYIDCLIFPSTDATAGPVFRAIRNGAQKDQVAPGEPRIMRSLLQALKKSVEIARVF